MTLASCLACEEMATELIERIVWPDRPFCPLCGESKRIGRLHGLTTAHGAWKCYHCRKLFSPRNGTALRNSHLPVQAWLQAIFLCVAEEGHCPGSTRLASILGISSRAAWLLRRRIIRALATNPVAPREPNWHVSHLVRRASWQMDEIPVQAGPVFRARYSRFCAAAGPAFDDPEVIERFLALLHAMLQPETPEEERASPANAVAPAQMQLELALDRMEAANYAVAHLSAGHDRAAPSL